MATIVDTQFNDLMDEVERRLYDLEQLIASSDGLGNESFGSITLVSPIDGSQYLLDTLISPPSGTISVTPGTFFDNSFADVTWTAPSDGTANRFLIEWAKKTGSSYSIVDAQTVDGNSFRINNVIPGQIYGVRVSSISRIGKPSTPNPSSGFVDFTASTDNAAPAAPTGVVVFAAIRSLVVRWNANSEADVINGKGQYLVQVFSDAGLTTLVKQEFVGATVATFEDLSSNTTYWARVYAIDNSGNQSSASATASGTTGQVVNQDLLDGAVIATKLAVGSANRLMDSSFEGSDLSRYWTLFNPASSTWGLDSATHYHGTQSVRFSSTNTTISLWGICQQEIRVTPGETLYLQFLWGQSANARQSHFKVDFLDNTGVAIGSTWFPLGATDGAVAGGTVVTGSYVVPTGAVNALVACAGGWSSDGLANFVNFDGIYLTSNPGLAWAPAANEILPAVTFADMLVANAVQLRHMSANSVDATVLKANTVATVHISTVGLDAGVVTFGVMSGDRISTNTADIGILKTSTLTTANLTVNGGSIIIGSPGGGAGTSGVLINSQGIRVYQGTTLTGTFDVTGAISMQGSITSGSSISIGNYSLTSSTFYIVASTSYSDTRAIKWISSTGGYTQARMWAYDNGNQGLTYNGVLNLEADEIDTAADSYRFANNAKSQTYITIFPNGTGAPGNVILGSGATGSLVSVSNGTPVHIGGTGGTGGYALLVDGGGASHIEDTPFDVAEEFGNGASTIRTVNAANSAYRDHWAANHVNTSDPKFKSVLGPLSPGESLSMIKAAGKPYRFRWNKGMSDDGKTVKIGVSSTAMPTEVQIKGLLRHPNAPREINGKTPEVHGDPKYLVGVTMVDPQAQIAILWGAVQDLSAEIDSLKSQLAA